MNDVGLWLGIGVGALGFLAGIAAIVWATGLFEYMGGKKRFSGSAVSRQALKDKLLALNSVESPYELKPNGETDLVLEWRIANVNWKGVFARERLKKTYRAFMVLDEARHAVRLFEESAEVRWSANAGSFTPSVHFETEFFKGRVIFQKSWGIKYNITPDLKFSKVFDYNFDINDVHNPVRNIVETAGWEYVPVVRKSHTTYKSLGPYFVRPGQ